MSYQREFTQKINIGIIGIGSHGYRNILPAMNYLPVNIRALCSRDARIGQQTAAQYGCTHYQTPEEMYAQADIDAVFISVSPKLHPQLTIQALKHGKHVWIEKPVAMRALEVEQMLAQQGDQVVVAGYKKIFSPATRKAVEIVNSPKYGNLHSVLAIYPMTIPAGGQTVLESTEVTNWLNNGIHPLSYLMALAGKVTGVTAMTNAAGRGSVVLQFVNGVIGNFHMSSGPQPRLERYAAYGENWQIDIENAKITLQRGIPFSYKETTDYAPPGDEHGALVWEPSNCMATLENKALFTQGMYFEMKYFCDCILDQRKPELGTLEFSLELMRVYEAALLSGGKTIYLD